MPVAFFQLVPTSSRGIPWKREKGDACRHMLTGGNFHKNHRESEVFDFPNLFTRKSSSLIKDMLFENVYI